MKKVLPYVSNEDQVFLVPFCLQDVYVSKDIAVVGNAAEILEQNFGKDIDSHGTVIRFNGAITSDYELHVGKKMTHLFCTDKYYNNQKQRISEDGQICYNKLDITKLKNVNVVAILRNENVINCLKKNHLDASVKKSVYINNANIQNNILKRLDSQLYDPHKLTAGMSILVSLIDLGLVPNVYGFTHTLDRNYRTYYWPDIIRDKKENTTHNFENEYHILSYLRSNKLINFRP